MKFGCKNVPFVCKRMCEEDKKSPYFNQHQLWCEGCKKNNKIQPVNSLDSSPTAIFGK